MRKGSSKKMLSIFIAAAMLITGAASGVVKGHPAVAAKKAVISFTSAAYTVQEGKTLALKGRITRKNVKKIKSMTWSSKNTKIAKVSKIGTVKGIKAGTAKIVCKVKYQAKGAKKYTSKTIQTKVKVVSKEVDKSNLTATNLTTEHKSKNGIVTQDNGMMRTNLTAQDITTVMGIGWNIGNSLEQTLAKSCTSLSDEEQKKLTDEQWVTGYETNADNVVSSQRLMDGLKSYGINTIRIPVAWSNLMKEEKKEDGSTYYKINEAYMNRVETVMNYCLNDEMYVIINIHWDNGWWGMFGDADKNVRKQAWKKYEDMWTQIADRYAEYSDHLIFEGANEELGERLNDDWKGGSKQTGTLTAEETYALTNQINQKFVDIVRSTGKNADGTYGNNYYRTLLIPGYDTNLHQTCGDKYSDKVKKNDNKLSFEMPKDVSVNGKNRLFVSIHYYDPLGWGIAKSASSSYETPKGTSNYKDTWGSKEDYAAMQEDFDAVNDAFIKKGYGVIFGEFGVVSVNKDGIPAYFEQFFKSCKQYGMLPVMWDEGTYVDRSGTANLRKNAYFVYSDIGEVISKITGAVPKLSADAQKLLTLTGIPESPVTENQNPLVVATWDGDFMRNTTTSDSVDLKGIGQMFGQEFLGQYNNNTVGGCFNTKAITINPNYDLSLTAHASSEWWHSHFKLSDWSKLKEPCIRITMHDDEYSQSADLQLVYSDDAILSSDNGAAWRYERDFEQVEWDELKEYVKVDGTVAKRTIAKKDEAGNSILADTAWIGKCLSLNSEILKTYPVVLITTNYFMGVDFVKVEICDAAYNADGSEYQIK